MYSVVYGGFTPGLAGLIWFVKEIMQVASQVPIGWLCDHTTNKKKLLIVFSVLCSLTQFVVPFTLNVPVLIVTKCVEGIASTGLRVFKGPLILGIAGHEIFDSVASKTEIAEHSGSLVVAVGAGLIAYFLYPNIGALFYATGGFSFMSVFCVAFMRKSKKNEALSTNNEDDLESVASSVINDDLARNSFNRGKKDSYENETSSDLLKIFFHDKNLALFSMSVFLFHFGNAAVLPLLSQSLALNNSRGGILFLVANIAIAQSFSVAGVKMVEFFRNRGYRINIPIFLGFGLLVPRIVIIFLLLKYWPNQYALVATQILDGIGAGTNGLAIVTVTKELTYGSNIFGVAIALVSLCEAFGSGMSNLCAGYVVTAFGYERGFLFLLVPAVLAPILILTIKVQAPDMSSNLDTNAERDDNDAEKAIHVEHFSDHD